MKGFSLVEVLVALLLVSTMLLASGWTLNRSLKLTTQSSYRYLDHIKLLAQSYCDLLYPTS